jgi:hypothetical protein
VVASRPLSPPELEPLSPPLELPELESVLPSLPPELLSGGDSHCAPLHVSPVAH